LREWGEFIVSKAREVEDYWSKYAIVAD